MAEEPAQHTSVFEAVEALGHEQIMYCNDPETGLKAIIGVHNTVLGPSLGGLRFWNYASEADALTDVLRLSRGMTFKSALAGLNLGGGKAVILGDPSKIKNEVLLRRFGKFVDNLGGKYITAEDVGVDVRDMTHIHAETDHVTGLPKAMGGSGDPSPVTAYGVYLSLKAAQKFLTGSEKLEGKKIVVEGVGKVGGYLVERLREDKAEVFIYDISSARVEEVAEATGAKPIAKDDVMTADCDIYAPCALGATLNPDSIPKLKCSIVCGGANNQLLDEQRDGLALQERGILYAPDFMVNAGGIINVSVELEGYNQERALEKAEGIYDTTLRVLKTAQEDNITTHEAALNEALNRIQSIGRIRRFR